MKKSRSYKNLAKRFGDPLRVDLEIEQLPAEIWEHQQQKISEAVLGCANSLLGRLVDEFSFCHVDLSAEFSKGVRNT